MRPIAPRLGDDVSDEVTVAEDQHEYKTLVAAFVSHENGSRSAYTRWTLTTDERVRVANGEDVYVAFPECVAPHLIMLRPEWAAALPEGESPK